MAAISSSPASGAPKSLAGNRSGMIGLMPRLDDVIAEFGRIPFEIAWAVEDLGNDIQRLGIDDPHGSGLGIDLIWMSNDVDVATLGQGTSVDVSNRASTDELIEFLVSLMSKPCRERFSRSRNVLELGSGPRPLRFASAKGLFGWFSRLRGSRSYMPYQRAN